MAKSPKQATRVGGTVYSFSKPLSKAGPAKPQGQASSSQPKPSQPKGMLAVKKTTIKKK